MRKNRRIKVTESSAEFIRKEQIFASTEGTRIRSCRVISGAGISCKAFGPREIQRRSYPSASKNYASAGYEFIQSLGLRENAERIRDEALRLLESPPCPARTFDLILKDSILALQIHETIGHAAELDRAYGHEDSFGGRTFLLPEKLDTLRIGSAAVTLIANRPEDKSGAGFVAYDDEGCPARETPVILNGIFRGCLSNRETALKAGLKQIGGSAIAEDWASLPLVRMTTLSLLAGKTPFRKLIERTKEGLLLDSEASWSVDEQREDFQIGAEIAWHIKNGKIIGAFKNPLYRAKSGPFWRKCAAVAEKKDGALFSFSDCGKGGPLQNAFVSHGSSPALFRGITCYPASR